MRVVLLPLIRLVVDHMSWVFVFSVVVPIALVPHFLLVRLESMFVPSSNSTYDYIFIFLENENKWCIESCRDCFDVRFGQMFLYGRICSYHGCHGWRVGCISSLQGACWSVRFNPPWRSRYDIVCLCRVSFKSSIFFLRVYSQSIINRTITFCFVF